MKRVAHSPREALPQIAQGYGFGFTVIDGKTYWDESAYYQFTLAQIENDIEKPTQDINTMLLEAADKVIASDKLLRQFAIPESAWAEIRRSWDRDEPTVYGRIDLCYDGKSPAKLYEANYDTPTSLFEAAVFQWDWLESQFPHLDQYNTIHEKLVEQWRRVKSQVKGNTIHFAGVLESVEDSFTLEYLLDTAVQAGFEARLIDIADIGIGNLPNTGMLGKIGFSGDKVFTDPDDEVIENLFKLYPWEHLLREEFAKYIDKTPTRWIEPTWKAVISNKAILPLLWDMYPNHPNLIESRYHDDPNNVPEGFVLKPFFSREGAGVVIPGIDEAEQEEEHGGYIIQRYTPLPKFGDSYAVIGSWTVGGEACGIGIREDASLITKNTSRFLPHLIKG
jgi:glutathionylspermidine synthase